MLTKSILIIQNSLVLAALLHIIIVHQGTNYSDSVCTAYGVHNTEYKSIHTHTHDLTKCGQNFKLEITGKFQSKIFFRK